MRIMVLGPLEAVRDDGTPVDLGSRRQRRLLGSLVINAGSLVSEGRLTEMVWDPEQLPDGGVRALRTVVSRLRQTLGPTGSTAPHIVTRPSGYLMELNGSSVDAIEFDAAVHRACDHLARRELDAALAEFDAALALWRGPAYAEFAEDDWARIEAARLDELRTTAREGRVDAQLEQGHHAEAIGELERMIADDPYRERPRAQLITALYRSGRHADALRSYHDYRTVLAEDLGLEPSAELRELEHRVLAHDPELTSPATARSVKSYELIETIGEGAWGEVWIARQQSVDRDVAVKVIGRNLADDPDFIRRFEIEARVIAALEHPHIVPLYDFWRDPSGAYLVMRLLRGGSLADRLSTHGPLELGDAVRLVQQVGTALGAAHRVGVVHRDVKPSNILTDDEGNAYLGDFGVALAEGAERSLEAAGSLGFAAPEQLRGEPVGPTADVHGLAMTLWAALSAPRGHIDSSSTAYMAGAGQQVGAFRDARPDLPDAVGVVLRRATQHDPDARQQTVAEFVEDFCRAAASTPTRSVAAPHLAGSASTFVPGRDVPNPYKGLRAFGVGDSADFFGRDQVVRQVVATMAEHPVTMVVGPSGAGKSSVVRAGVIPALRDDAIAGSSRWFVITIVPGTDPFVELEAALLQIAVNPPSSMLEQLAAGPDGVARAVKRAVPGGDQLVLVIDQFEELFTQCTPEIASQFVEAVIRAASEPNGTMRVLVTVRADFFDRPLRDHRLADALADAVVPVGALSPDGLRAAIIGPAHRVGVLVEPALVDTLVADAGGEAAALPLAQYMLSELFERRAGLTLVMSAYRELGGLAGVVAARAEAAYDDLGESTQDVARRVFGRLVTVNDDSTTRRRARRDDLEIGADGDAVSAVVDRFSSARLLVFDRDPATRGTTVEIAHEALLTAWPRLRGWLAEDRDMLRSVAQIGTVAADWMDGGEQPADLLRGARLAAALDLIERFPDRLTDGERRFVIASSDASSAEESRQRAQNRRLRRRLAAVAVLLVVSAAAGAVAVQQRSAARSTGHRARTAALVAESAQHVNDDVEYAALLAVEARRRDRSPQTLGALERVFTSIPSYALGTSMSSQIATNDVTFTSAGDAVVATADGVALIDIESRRSTWLFERHARIVALSPTDDVLFVADDSTWWIVEIPSATVTMTGPIEGDEPVRASFDGVGTHVGVATADGGIVVIDARSGEQHVLDPTPTSGGAVLAGNPIPGAARIVFLVWDRIVVVDAESATVAAERDVRPGNSSGMTVADGRIWHVGGSVRAYDIETLEPVTEPIAPETAVTSETGELTLALVGNEIVIDGTSGTVGIDIGDGDTRVIATDPRNRNFISGSAIDPTRGVLARFGPDGGVVLSALDGAGLGVAANVESNGSVAQLSTDGGLLLTAPWTDANGTVTLWRLGGGRPERLVEFSANGGLAQVSGNEFVFISAGGRIELWDESSARMVTVWDASDALATAASVTPTAVVVGRIDGSIDVYDRATGRRLLATDLQTTKTGGERAVSDIVLSPDGGRMVAMGAATDVTIVDTATWSVVRNIAGDLAYTGFSSLVFSSDGGTAYTYATGGVVVERDPTTFEIRRQSAPIPPVLGVVAFGRVLELSNDGSILKVGGSEGAVLVDTATLELIGDPIPNDGGADFGPAVTMATEAGYLATIEEGRVVVRDVNTATWERLACSIPGQNLTREQWDRLELGEPHRAICDNLDVPA